MVFSIPYYPKFNTLSEKSWISVEEYHTHDNEQGNDDAKGIPVFFVFFIEKHDPGLLGLLIFVYTTGEMLPFQERKKFRKILYSKASILVLFVASVFVSRGAWQVYQKAEIARAEKDESARMLIDLKNRDAALEESLTRLKSSQGIEDEVRQKYAVARPGEEIVVVVDESGKKGKNGDEAPQKSFWQRFISLFTGN